MFPLAESCTNTELLDSVRDDRHDAARNEARCEQTQSLW